MGLYVLSSAAAASERKISNQFIIFSWHYSMVPSFHKLLEYYPSWNSTQELFCNNVFHHHKKTKQPPSPHPKQKVWQITVMHSRLRFIHIIFIQQWSLLELKASKQGKSHLECLRQIFSPFQLQGVTVTVSKGVGNLQMHGKKMRKLLWSQNLSRKRKKGRMKRKKLSRLRKSSWKKITKPC